MFPRQSASGSRFLPTQAGRIGRFEDRMLHCIMSVIGTKQTFNCHGGRDTADATRHRRRDSDTATGLFPPAQ